MGNATAQPVKSTLKTAIQIAPEFAKKNAASNKDGTKYRFSDSHVALLDLLMPVYFVREDLTKEVVDVARESWKLVLGCPIMGELNPHFTAMDIKNTIGHQSTVSWFFDTFYRRFFDVHPSARPLFTGGLKTQGRFMVKMITLLLSNLEDPTKFNEALVKLAEVHNERGIKAIEYGVVGEILFYTLRTVLGPAYDMPTHKAWAHVFSSMLKTLIPLAVQYEMTTGSKFQGARDYSRSEGEAMSMSMNSNNSSVHNEDDKNNSNSRTATTMTAVTDRPEGLSQAPSAECPFR